MNIQHLTGKQEMGGGLVLWLDGDGNKTLETRGKLSKSIGYGMYASSKVEKKSEKSYHLQMHLLNFPGKGLGDFTFKLFKINVKPPKPLPEKLSKCIWRW